MWDIWWAKWHWTGFSPRVLRFSSVNFIPPVIHYKEKRTKPIIVITGLHNKPQGCDASVASAAEPFTTKKKKKETLHKASLPHLLQTDMQISGIFAERMNLRSL
jgi:hypothetical protein